VERVMNQLRHVSFRLFKGAFSSDKTSIKSFPLALLGIAQICSWGTLYYSFPQLAEAMIGEFGWIKSDVYAALTICFLFSSITAISVGKLLDKGYGRQIMVSGSIVAGLLLIVASQVNSILGLYLVFAGIGVLHSATLYEAAFSVIVNNYQHETARKKIITLTLWGGFASTIFIPLIEYLILSIDWRDTLIVLGLINIVICAVIYGFLPQNRNKQYKEHKSSNEHNVRWAMKQPIFWALLLCFSLFAATATTFKFHLYPILLEKGLSIQDIMITLAIMGPSQVFGRFAMGFISSNISALQLGIFTTAVLPLTFFALALLPTNIWLFIPFIILFGAATGIMTIVKGIAIPELLTREAYGVINGAMNIPIKLIKAAAPAIAAFVWVMTTSYDSVLILLGLTSLLAVLCFTVVKYISKFSKSPN